MDMFSKEIYVRRRRVLIDKMTDMLPEGNRGIVLFIGNVDAPAQYKDNCYKYRQDSSWLYYFGLDEPRYAAILDLDSGDETIFADDVEIGDIIWMGPQPSIQSLAESVGVKYSKPYAALEDYVAKAIAEVKGGKISFRVDKAANLHALIGKASFTAEQLAQNYGALIEEVLRLKPSSAKGIYLRKVTLSSTMGPGIPVDPSIQKDFTEE